MLIRALEPGDWAEWHQWARARGLEELASDALRDNVVSHRAHERVGFTEVERAVRYRKPLTEDQPPDPTG